jgi:hypothetical protein
MRKHRQFIPEPFCTPMEMGRFVDAPAAESAGETNFCRTKRKLHRAQCWECDGTGKITIYPLVDIPCHACRGKGYFLELHIGFGKSREN